MQHSSLARGISFIAILCWAVASCTDFTGPPKNEAVPDGHGLASEGNWSGTWAIVDAVSAHYPANGPRLVGVVVRDRTPTFARVVVNEDGRESWFEARAEGGGWVIAPSTAGLRDELRGLYQMASVSERIGEVRDAYGTVMDENWYAERGEAGDYVIGPHYYGLPREARSARYLQPADWYANGHTYHLSLREWRWYAQARYEGTPSYVSQACSVANCTFYWRELARSNDGRTFTFYTRGAEEVALAYKITATPDLSVSEISGPTIIHVAGDYRYSVNASGGTGTYKFTWHRTGGTNPKKVETNTSGYSYLSTSARPYDGLPDLFDVSVTVESGTAPPVTRTISVDGSNALSFEIDGATKVFSPGVYTYTINPVGGNGSYTYQWTGDAYGTGRSFSLNVVPCDPEQAWNLVATVSSGGYSVTIIRPVLNMLRPC